MKYLKYILLLFVLTGCEKVWTVEQIIKNSTWHDIKIETYYEGKEREVITIAPNKSYTKTSIKEPRNTDDMFILQTWWIDSVNIIFDNKKIIIQSCNNSSLMSCPDVDRNIFRLGYEYDREEMGTRSIRYTYTITEEDYNNAVPIEE